MVNRKKAGISKCDRKFQFYADWLEGEGMEYRVLDYRKNNFSDIEQCSSLLLSGGDDIYPELYSNWDKGTDRNTYKPERDSFEFRLLEYAFSGNLPILGICRGMQLINCKLNGNLIIDIETICGTNHKKISDTQDSEHSVNVLGGTLLHGIIKEESGTVNSSHHQGIDRLGEGLMAAARSNDGIIEGIEWEDKDDRPFLIGIQWHPERMKNKLSPFSRNILRRFKEETLRG